MIFKIHLVNDELQILAHKEIFDKMYEQDEFDATEIFNPTSPPMPEIELNSTNDLANSSAASGFDYLPRAPAQILFPKFTNPDQLEVGSCYF